MQENISPLVQEIISLIRQNKLVGNEELILKAL